jgi:hypothetical protein
VEGGLTAKEVTERAARTHILHAVGEAFLNCGKGIAGLICTLGCIMGGAISATSEIFAFAAFTVGQYGSIPGGALGLIAGTLVGQPFQGMAKGAKVGAIAGAALIGIPTSIALAVPYLIGSSLLKASAKGVEKTIGISDDAKELVKYVLFVEYIIDWEKVGKCLQGAFTPAKA